MGKFSNYIDNINLQAKLLRENTTKASGIDCSGKNIGECASVVLSISNSKERYVTPDWYPDIIELVEAAPEIVIGSKTYYPIWGAIVNDSEDVTPFYYNESSAIGAINYGRSTCGSAVLCSDMCNNDINTANSDNLIIGESINHKWDKNKDIQDPSGKSDYKVRWYIIYHTKLSLGTQMPYDGQDSTKLEQYFYQGTQGYLVPGSRSVQGSTTLKRLIYGEKCNNSVTQETKASITLPNLRILECYSAKIFRYQALILPMLESANIKVDGTFKSAIHTTLGGDNDIPLLLNIIGEVTSIKNISLNGIADVVLPTTVVSLSNVGIEGKAKTVILPETLTSIEGTSYQIEGKFIKSIKIPDSLKTWVTDKYTLAHTEYIELFKDFNISNINFTSYTPAGIDYSNTAYIIKHINWYKNLCIWLKDRTGEDANTMILGPKGLGIAQNIWLTFNPNDKRDITWVEAGTEGAINIVQFITEQLNWTLS